MKAGIVDAGIQCFSRAAAEGEAASDRPLQAKAMFELGSALVHCGRNRFEEGAAVLHEVLSQAETLNEHVMQAAVVRELAWVELLAARYERCEAWLRRALAVATGDRGETAAAGWVVGMARTEGGRYGGSMDLLRRAVDLADGIDDARKAGIARALLGKAYIMRRELDEGRAHLERSLETFRSAGWTWLLP